MKKLFAILALVLGMVSCQTEPEGLDVVVGGEQDVNITVALPEGTRADSAQGFDLNNLGDYSIRYILEIWYNDHVVRDFKITDSTSATFPVRLAPGRAYTFTVWADLVQSDKANVEVYSDADLFYNTAAGLDEIEVNVDEWTANTEARDAWTATQTVNYTSNNKNIGMTLTRPFAKVRVVATDIAEIRNFGIKPTNATVEYLSDVYVGFNAVEGKVVETSNRGMSHAFNYADVDTYEDYETSNQLTVFTDYLFVPADGNIKFTLSVYDNEKADALIKKNNFNTTIPVVANKVTTIKGHVLTDGGDLSVDIENGFDGEDAYVDSRNAAQSSLDNVIANTTIYLEPNVNYGTLYLRPVAGGAQTKVVDWIGNNYRFETYSLFENLTIVGAEGATVDAIKIEGGTYYNTDHSQKDTYPVILSLIELKNVVLDGVTFTGKGGYDPQGYGNVVNLSGNNIKVDGLTFKNCVLNNNENNARLLYKTESTTHVHTYTYNGETYTFTPSLKNITITDCTLNGGYMGLELREAENITITNNEFNVADRNILLPVNTGCTYSGYITITGNVSNNAKERFVRADGTGDAIVVISNNTLHNYRGEDADYIKVTNGNNVTIENNILINNIETAAQFISALNATGRFVLVEDITIETPQAGVLATRTGGTESVIDLNGHTVTFANTGTEPIAKIEAGSSVTFVGEGSLVVAENSTPAILNEGTVVDETFNITNEIISGAGEVGYVVSDAKGMIAFADEVKGGNTFEGQTVKLAKDIDLTGYEFCAIGHNPENYEITNFKGIFDGNNKTISGISRWDSTYASKRSVGLFARVENATVKNLKLDNFVAATYGGEAGAIACVAVGDCLFENLTLTNGSVVSYNNDTSAVVGWANVGNFTFKNIDIANSVTIFSLWDSYDTTLGGVIGTLESPSTAKLENINVACVLNAFSDACANYQWFAYRRTGMLIGNMDETQTINDRTVPDPAAAGVTCENVTVTYGDWMHYHYCEFESNGAPSYADEGDWKYSRVEGQEWGREENIDTDNCQHDTDETHNIYLPVDQLFGGGQGVYGLREYKGVTVYYPASYTPEE